MEGLDALLERRFRFSVCFRNAIGLAGEGEVLAGKGEGLSGKEEDLGERKRAKRNYEREFKSEAKESWLCVILLLGSNTRFEAIIYASTQFGSLNDS